MDLVKPINTGLEVIIVLDNVLYILSNKDSVGNRLNVVTALF